MKLQDIKTIQDFIAFCKEVLATKPEYMSEEEHEQPATAVFSACLLDSIEELYDIYPELVEISDISSNLEWSNSFNTSEDWRKIRVLLERLEKKI